MAVLTARSVRVGLKNGYGFDEFCEKYKLTEEELKYRIKTRIYQDKRTSDKIIKEIEANSRGKKSRLSALMSADGEAIASEMIEVIKEIVAPPDGEPQATIELIQERVQQRTEMIREMKCQMEGRKAELLAIISEAEAEYDASTLECAGKTEAEQSLKQEIDQIKQLLQQKNSEHTKLLREIDRLTKAQNAASRKRSKAEAELDELQEKLASLQEIELVQINI